MGLDFKQRKLREPNAIQAGATVVGKQPTNNPDGSYTTLNFAMPHIICESDPSITKILKIESNIFVVTSSWMHHSIAANVRKNEESYEYPTFSYRTKSNGSDMGQSCSEPLK